MFQLLQPLMLFSLAGLAVPIAIHLWNRKRGRRIKVGSVALLQETQSRRVSSIRLNEVGLLLLRCVLLGVLALLLAGPQWSTVQKNTQKTWVLVSPGLLAAVKDSNSRVRQTLDSLAGANRELRVFTKDFTVFSLQSVPKWNNTAAASLNYWSLLREADQRLPARTPVYLLTTERLDALQGKRPAVDVDVRWLTFEGKDSATYWLADAYQTSTDSIAVYLGESKPEGNRLVTLRLPPVNDTFPVVADASLQIMGRSGQWQVSLINQVSPALTVDTSTYSIAIYAGKDFSEDARYVKMACEAISRFTRRKLVVNNISEKKTIQGKPHWIFWLSHEPMPESLLGANATLFRYPAGKATEAADTWLRLPQPISRPVRIYREFAQASGEAVWFDGYGRSVLGFAPRKSQFVYQFNTRFHPEWNDLVWHEAFPQALLSLFNQHLWPARGKLLPKDDQRLVDARQLMPGRTANPGKAVSEKGEEISLREPLLVVMLLLWVLERWLSDRTKKQAIPTITA